MFWRKITELFTALWFAGGCVAAEGVRGIVKDSLTGKPIASVSVLLMDEAGETMIRGGVSDAQGFFSLPGDVEGSFIEASFLGYETKRMKAAPEEMTVWLRPVAYEIGEVTVRPKRERYSRRGNPAVELARQVIAHKGENRIEAMERYRVEVYEKLSLAWDDFRPNLDRGWMKRFAFVKNYTDTSVLNGKPILILSVREKLSELYYRQSPETYRTILKGRRQEGIDNTIDQNGTLSANIEEIFRPVNIFENDVAFLLSRFVSPLHSSIATVYYHFYITDTIVVEGDSCATLAFVPSNSEGYGFTGKMAVTLDGRYAVKKLVLNLSRKANVNWVDDFRIEQTFRRTENSTWVIGEENTYINFFASKGVPRIYAHQVRHYDRYDFAFPGDSVFALSGNLHTLPGAEEQPDCFWQQARHIPLRPRENILGSLLRDLRGVPIFNAVIKTGEVLISGYLPTRKDQNLSAFDFGPVNTFLSGNQVEGVRLRSGGMTTAQCHPQLFAEGFLAYGTKDRRLKYQTQVTYSFNRKRVHAREYPLHALSLLCEYDIYTLGQEYLYTNKDNLFVSPPGLERDEGKMQYIRKAGIKYERDYRWGFAFKTWLQRSNNEAAGTLYYEPLSNFERIKSFTVSELGLSLRYAKNERPFNSRRGRASRLNLARDVAVFTFSHYSGLKGLLGGKYNYQHSEASMEQRLWLSSFGHIDAKIKAGAVWNSVPFPLLILPNTNQSVTIQPESFNLMRPVEFVADHYLSLHATYFLKGWIQNRLPVIKWLKLREVVSVNAFWGGLSHRNNPLLPGSQGGLFRFPEDTQALGKLPYVEASVGLENIFKCLRVDYYRRLTYLNDREGLPPLRKGALRIEFRFTF
ncbi:MAG: DUF5686 family protein [Tannerellaceae bacterium]|jgi:hypothetical protein|nr:DUF5686 family protein [Tannerellaceae bacterium]